MLVRQMRSEDVPVVAALTAQAFASPEQARAVETVVARAYKSCPMARPDLCWLFEDEGGRVVGSWQNFDFKVRVGSVDLRAAGCAAVAVEKQARGRSILRHITDVGMPGVASDGFDMFMGFAQRGAFYSRLGCVPVAPEHWFSMSARRVPTDGEALFRPFEESDLTHVLGAYHAANRGRPLSIVRDETYWAWMQRRAPEIWVHPDGYLGVRREENAIEVRELGGVHPRFYRQALGKLAQLARDHGVTSINGHVPADDPLVAEAVPYGGDVKVTYAAHTGCIGRIANVVPFWEHAVPELAAMYTRAGGPRMALQLDCEGTALTSEFGSGEGSGEGSGLRVRVAVTAGELLQLVVGSRGSAQLFADAALGPEERGALALLFPRRAPFVWATDRW